MENRWLLTLLLAPLLSPAALAVEAYSLYWYMLEEDTLSATAGRDPNYPLVESMTVGHRRLE
jgi:hypothetical protein